MKGSIIDWFGNGGDFCEEVVGEKAYKSSQGLGYEGPPVLPKGVWLCFLADFSLKEH